MNYPQLKQVRLLNSLFKERENINRSYLLELDSDCLLQNFYFEAGICTPNSRIHNPETAKIHWGWESPSCQLRGHFLGHWLSAASILIATYGDIELSTKLNHIIDELERCQKLNGGEWVSSIPEKYFARLETTEYIWSPQYTMHKTCMGLLHSYQFAGNRKALKILNSLSNWYVKWVNYEQKHNPKAIYNGEQGGMLEIWATLYELTGYKKYMKLAEAYSHNTEFEILSKGEDALTNIHANASIPLSHGACKMYQITKDEKWLHIAKEFWKWAVEERDCFCTGGCNSGEFWIPCRSFGSFLNSTDQEFCTVYNMCRFAKYMYEITGEAKYQDYIEINLYNGFLAQQNKISGMPAYFLPLQSGAKKSFGSKRNDFFCCHGTMVQAQSSYAGFCYAEDDDSLIINQYIPSIYEAKDFSLEQSVDMKFYDTQSTFTQKEQGQMSRWQLKFVIKSKGCHKKILFRIPQWIKNNAVFIMDGKEFFPKIKNNYAEIENNWKDNVINLSFVPKLYERNLSGDEEKFAVMEGPIVLAGLTDCDSGIRMNGNIENTLIKQNEHLYSSFTWKQSTYNTKGQDKNFTFVPLYEITDEIYTVYFSKK